MMHSNSLNRPVGREASNGDRRRSVTASAGAIDFEAEAERFVVGLGLMRDKAFGARPLSEETRAEFASSTIICERAATILDEEGPAALTVRRLAADLKISTRTLYKRIQSRENMLRLIATAFLGGLDLTVHPQCTWQSTALEWCVQLRRSLTAHPHLALLAGDQIVDHVSGSIADLLKNAAQEDIPRRRAVICCQALVAVTVSDALAENRRAQHSTSAIRGRSSDLQFVETVSLILECALQANRDEEAANIGGVSTALGGAVLSGGTGRLE